MSNITDYDYVVDSDLTQFNATYTNTISEHYDDQSTQHTFGDDLAEHPLAFEAYVAHQQNQWS